MNTGENKTYTSNLKNFTGNNNVSMKDMTLTGFCKDIQNPTNMEVMRWAGNAYKMLGKSELESSRR